MSRHAYVPPAISVEPREGRFYLMASSHGRTELCGERLLRGEPWPAVAFSHPSRESAERDAETLRKYLDACATGRVKDREVRRGWWE